MADPRDPKVVWDEFYQGTWIPWRDDFLSRLAQLEEQVKSEKSRTTGAQGERGAPGPKGVLPGPDGDKGPDGYPPPIACRWNCSLQLNAATATKLSVAATAAEVKLVGVAISGTVAGCDVAVAKDSKMGNRTDTAGKAVGIGTKWTWADLVAWWKTPRKKNVSAKDDEISAKVQE